MSSALTTDLLASLLVLRGVAPEHRSAALTRARKSADIVRILATAHESRRQHRAFVRHLAALGRVARACGFEHTLHQVARLAAEHRGLAVAESGIVCECLRMLRGAHTAHGTECEWCRDTDCTDPVCRAKAEAEYQFRGDTEIEGGVVVSGGSR